MIRNSVPTPSVDRTSTRPRLASTLVRTTSSPTPRPDTSVTKVVVDKPGLERQPQQFLLVQALGVDALAGRPGYAPGRCRSAPVVGDGDDDLGAQLHGVQADGSVRRLACGLTVGRRFDAVIDGVAHQVHQGIGKLLQNAAVHLRVRAAGVPADVFALGARQVPHCALQLVGDGGHRNHLGPGRPILQVVQRSGQLVELGVGGRVDAEPVFEHPPDPQMRRRGLTDQSGQFLQTLGRYHNCPGGRTCCDVARVRDARGRRTGRGEAGAARCVSVATAPGRD